MLEKDTKTDTGVEATAGPEDNESVEKKPEEKQEETTEQKTEEKTETKETEETEEVTETEETDENQNQGEDEEQVQKDKKKNTMVTMDRFDEVNSKNKELKRQVDQLQQGFKTLQDDAYVNQQAAKRQKMVDDGMETEEIERALRVDNVERENKILKAQMHTLQRSTQPSPIDNTMATLRETLSNKDKQHFDILEKEINAEMSKTSEAGQKSLEIAKLAFNVARGANMDKLINIKSIQEQRQIIDTTSVNTGKSGKPVKKGDVKNLTADDKDYAKNQGRDLKQYSKDKAAAEKSEITPEVSVKT